MNPMDHDKCTGIDQGNMTASLSTKGTNMTTPNFYYCRRVSRSTHCETVTAEHLYLFPSIFICTIYDAQFMKHSSVFRSYTWRQTVLNLNRLILSAKDLNTHGFT